MKVFKIVKQFNMGGNNWEDDEEIQIFREYLRIPSVQPNVDYGIEVIKIYFKIYSRTFLMY